MDRVARNNFDGLRLIGALLVIVSHASVLTGHGEVVLVPGSPHALTAGSSGVAMFFAISGYLVTRSWFADPHILRFAARRLLRVWPGFAAVVILTGVAAMLASPADPMLALAYPMAGARYFQNLTMVDYWDWLFFPLNPVHFANGSLWTIPVEVRCYLILAAVGLCLRGYAKWLAVLWPLLLLFPATPLAMMGASFAVGAVLCLFPTRGRFMALGAAALAACFDPVFALRTLIALAAVEVGRASWPIMRSAGRFGDLSYGTYLWAWPVQQLVVVAGVTSTFLAGLGTVLCVLPVAWLSWHLIEKQALRFKPGQFWNLKRKTTMPLPPLPPLPGPGGLQPAPPLPVFAAALAGTDPTWAPPAPPRA